MNRFYTLKIAAGRSCVSVIRCHLCALQNALKDSNTEQWTTASGVSRNQQLIISWNELKNVSCKRQIRNKNLREFLKACKIGKYCTVRANFVYQNMSFCQNNHLQENKIEIQVQDWNFSGRYKPGKGPVNNWKLQVPEQELFPILAKGYSLVSETRCVSFFGCLLPKFPGGKATAIMMFVQLNIFVGVFSLLFCLFIYLFGGGVLLLFFFLVFVWFFGFWGFFENGI